MDKVDEFALVKFPSLSIKLTLATESKTAGGSIRLPEGKLNSPSVSTQRYKSCGLLATSSDTGTESTTGSWTRGKRTLET